MKSVSANLLLFAVFIAFWWFCVQIFDIPGYLLPAPPDVFSELLQRPDYFLSHGLLTGTEILAGLAAGIVAGSATALLMARFRTARSVLEPLVIVSATLPVFAIAPLLVIWFGFGMGSKVIMAALIIYFPLTIAFYDGLSRTDPNLIDMMRLYRATPDQTLQLIRLPAAVPALATGIRSAATVAPIGAIVGEWVGAAGGLGFIMLQANARGQTDSLFAALFVLAAMALALRSVIGIVLDSFLPRYDDTHPQHRQWKDLL